MKPHEVPKGPDKMLILVLVVSLILLVSALSIILVRRILM
jgi:hypothetical protein